MKSETTKLKVIVGFSSAILMAIVAVIVAYSSFKDLMQAVNLLAQPDQKLAKLNTILTDVVATENSVRSYLLLQDEKILDECNQHFAMVERNLDTLKALTADGTPYNSNMDTLQTLWQQKRQDLLQMVVLYKNKPQLVLSTQTLEDLAAIKPSSKIVTINTTFTARDDEMEDISSVERSGETKNRSGFFTSIKKIFKNKSNSPPVLLTLPINKTVQIDSSVVVKAEKDSSLTMLIRKLSSLRKKESRHTQQLTKSELAILSRNKNILTRITEIIYDLRQEALKSSADNVAQSKEVADKSTMIILILSGVGLLSTLFFIWLILKDITKSNFYKQQLLLAKKQAESVAKAKEDFLAYMSHEIRTPLNSIIGFSEQLSQVYIPAKERFFVSAINTSADHLMATVNDILDFSKIEASKLTIEKCAFSLQMTIEEVCKSLEFTAKEKNLQFIYTIPADLPASLIGDSFRLKQILYNLLANAIKFTPHGKVELLVKWLPVNKNSINMKIDVCDTGIGVSEDRLKNIFTGFSQADVSTSRKYGGSGLGLYITKKLVSLQHGRLNVLSRLGHGSTFSVELPYQISHEPVPQITASVQNKLGNYKLQNLKLLVVEDDELTTLLFHTIFKKWKVNFKIVDNTAEALALMSNNKYDLLLTDLYLPTNNSVQMITNLRSTIDGLNTTIPIIIITADIMVDHLNNLPQLGIHDLVYKPFKEELLFEKILSAVSISSSNSVIDGFANNTIQPSRLFSVEEIKKFSDNDPEAFYQIISTLASSSRKDLEKIEIYSKVPSWDKVSEVAHKLSSAFSHLKSHQIHGQLISIQESIAQDLDSVQLRQMVELIVAQAYEVLNQLDSEMVKPTTVEAD